MALNAVVAAMFRSPSSIRKKIVSAIATVGIPLFSSTRDIILENGKALSRANDKRVRAADATSGIVARDAIRIIAVDRAVAAPLLPVTLRKT